MFEPPPITRTGICSSWQYRHDVEQFVDAAGTDRGYCAGPPIFIQVSGANGWSRSEISLKASSEFMMDSVDIPGAHGHHDVAGAGFIV